VSTSAPGPRVTGLETEFGLLCAPTGPSEAAKADLPDVERAAALIFRHRPVGYRSTNLFLPNGGRLYLDIGAHPEYATAECVSVRDLVAQDQAGRAILADMATRAAAGLSQEGTAVRFHLLANNTDSAGHTYGCHESYSVPRSLLDATDDASAASSETTMAVLTSFLATRPVLVGSGRPLAGGPAEPNEGSRGAGEDAAWGLSPRAPEVPAKGPPRGRELRAGRSPGDGPECIRDRWPGICYPRSASDPRGQWEHRRESRTAPPRASWQRKPASSSRWTTRIHPLQEEHP